MRDESKSEVRCSGGTLLIKAQRAARAARFKTSIYNESSQPMRAPHTLSRLHRYWYTVPTALYALSGLRGLVVKLSPYFTLFSRMCTTTPYLSSAKTCTITIGSDTSPHVLGFTGFGHTGASATAWSKSSSHQRCGDGEVIGSGVGEAVCEAPTFTEWSTMLVPTVP